MFVCSVIKLYLTLLWPHVLKPARLLCPWYFLDSNTGVGCYLILLGSSQLRDQNCSSCHVSCTAGRFFTLSYWETILIIPSEIYQDLHLWPLVSFIWLRWPFIFSEMEPRTQGRKSPYLGVNLLQEWFCRSVGNKKNKNKSYFSKTRLAIPMKNKSCLAPLSQYIPNQIVGNCISICECHNLQEIMEKIIFMTWVGK